MTSKPDRIRRVPSRFCIATAGGRAWAQETGKTKDDALESLLKELNEPEKGATKSDKRAKADGAKGRCRAAKRPPQARLDRARPRKRLSDPADKPSAPKRRDAGKVSPKDQALDELLGKLGETKDEPAAEDQPQRRRPRRRAPAAAARGRGGKPAPTSSGAKTKISTNGSRS